MKTTLSVILIAMLVMSFNANAAMWTLVSQQYMSGFSNGSTSGYNLCTYQNGNYRITIRDVYFCKPYYHD